MVKMASNLVFREDTKSSISFVHLYKNLSKYSNSQHERRNLMLQRIKEMRHNLVDKLRELNNDLFEHSEYDDMELEEEGKELDSMDIGEDGKLGSKIHRFFLMESEWLCDVPDDLEENWLVKFIPQGFRVLVIAKRMHTYVFKGNKKILEMKSHFPGGGLSTLKRGMTILDCIFSKQCKKIFVMDCMWWNNMSMDSCDTVFRFTWLMNMFNEDLDLVRTSTKYSFQVLHPFPAEKSLIQNIMLEPFLINNKQVLYDGVVFYHREAIYLMESPLVAWLFSFMLPEKLGIDILDANRAKMPKDYESLEVYLAKLQSKG